MVIIVLLKLAFTCATPEAMFLRSRRRTRADSLPILGPFAAPTALARAFTDPVTRLRLTSSCPQLPWPDPCGFGRWCGCAVREPGVRAGAATHDNSRDP